MPAAGTRPFGRLDGRRAFVSGGAQGIGAAIVRSFADAGAHVVIADLDIAAASESCRAGRGDRGQARCRRHRHGASRSCRSTARSISSSTMPASTSTRSSPTRRRRIGQGCSRSIWSRSLPAPTPRCRRCRRPASGASSTSPRKRRGWAPRAARSIPPPRAA